MQVTVVASSKGGARKSAISTNLAAYYALQGKHAAFVVIVDSPVGSMADDLEEFLEIANGVLLPVLPSTRDLEATVPFLNSLAGNARVKKGKLPVALVGNRLKPWTGASQQARQQIKNWPYRWSVSYVIHKRMC